MFQLDSKLHGAAKFLEYVKCRKQSIAITCMKKNNLIV